MTEPTNHHLAITDHHGKQIRGKVVYLQPKANRWRPHTAIMHIVCSDWLNLGAYPAIYVTPAQSTAGCYAVYAYADADGQWLLNGSFSVEQDDKPNSPKATRRAPDTLVSTLPWLLSLALAMPYNPASAPCLQYPHT